MKSKACRLDSSMVFWCSPHRDREEGAAERNHSAGSGVGTSAGTEQQPILPIGRYRVFFEALEEVPLPPYSGSAWRGALGHALKRIFCITRQVSCSDCLLYHSCGYAYVFETPPPRDSERMRKYPAAPHPFVLVSGMQGGIVPQGSTFVLGLSLFGRGNHYLPYFIHALERAAQAGIGGRRGRMVLLHVEQQSLSSGRWFEIYSGSGPCRVLEPEIPEVPPTPGEITLRLETPLRIKREGSPIGVEEFGFGAFFSNLLRRISLLSYFHGEREPEVDFKALVEAARMVEIADRDLKWFDWKRYSSRQRQEMKLGGLLGQFTISSPEAAPFWPYLWLGQYVHAGAVTSMGLGRYRLLAGAGSAIEPISAYGLNA